MDRGWYFLSKSADGTQILATRLLDETKPALLSGNRERKRPVLFAGWEMDRVFRRWKTEKDLGPGWCTHRVVRGARRARRELGRGWQHHRGIERHGRDFRACPPKEERRSPPPSCRRASALHRWPQLLPGNEAVLIHRVRFYSCFRGCQHRSGIFEDRGDQDPGARRVLRPLPANRRFNGPPGVRS